MKKSTKIQWVLLAVGIVGMAVTMGIAIGTGMLMSREDAQVYAIRDQFEMIELDTRVPVELVVAEETAIGIYAKAWLKEPIDVNDYVDFEVKNGVLSIIETPPAAEFFGFFPQPYELIITLYMTQDTYDTVTGGKK